MEEAIKSRVSDYGYGTRREDQTDVIRESGLFEEPVKIEGGIKHEISAEEWLEAWRSHATLQRQATEKFHDVIDAIGEILDSKGETLLIPYVTRVWVAQLK